MLEMCEESNVAHRDDMADPLNPDDPRHFETYQPTPEQIERAEVAKRERLAAFGPDPDGREWLEEQHRSGRICEPDEPEPDPEKCPGCGEAMDWEEPNDYYDVPQWYCEACGVSFACAVSEDDPIGGWRYFHVTDTSIETELGPTFEGAAARLKEMRGG